MPAAINIKPTRMEYLRTMRRIAVSRKGLKLLKLKRSALILEFFNLSKTLADMRSGLQSKLVKGYEGIHATEMFVGPLRLEYESMRIPRIHELTLKSKNVMGVRIPEITSQVSGSAGQEYLLEIPAAVSQAIKSFESLHRMVLDVAEKETALRKLLMEIEKVKRRSNAIENVLIPRLQANARYIKFRFDEMERESFTKLKTVKRKLAEREEEEAKA
ncbi:MAG: V-type ATP synthase subunit D [Nitrososphaerota archaeon]|nr:V-type ATP synthase subunit D [Nitrososphaerota archaeon]MDG6903626.1 V-type ATP synthase subunit D [Nitrososphaerota archaeon]MDG6911922.1 V-type ATP synthase subunit D [Nitrososphaerota archaeon]MDG6924475.1 V-type ATP synthase subunit D [Nitrososphaerota archaeon]MDG6941073.1 V-type ATP synthase subunit D [Nitrososphaerota archaeon]